MKAQRIANSNSFRDSQEKFEEITSWLDSKDARGLTHSALEIRLETDGRELMRRLIQEHLDGRPSRSSLPIFGAEGTERTQARTRERTLKTVFGTVTIVRVMYGAPGHQGLAPLDAELNLPTESYSHGLRRKVAIEAAKVSFDEVTQSVAEATGVKVPKRQAEELARRAAMDFDAFYENRRRPAANEHTGPLLVLSTDAKGIVMRHEDLRPMTQRKASDSEPKLDKRLTKGEKSNRKRMSQVATVYTVNRFVRTPDEIVDDLDSVGDDHEKKLRRKKQRPKPQHKRVWASVEKKPEEVVQEMIAEGLRRDPRKRKKWVVLVDGGVHQLKLVKEALECQMISATIILDIIHVLEYLWKASHAFFGEASSHGEGWVTERLRRILQGQVVSVAAGIRRSATLRCLSGRKRKTADTCANYLLKYSKYMAYDKYLANGLPIATGVIEGACRHLVKDRMEITGARWSLDGSEAVLQLRALRSSGDFEQYWIFHEAAENVRNHATKYAHGHVPPTAFTGRRGLRLVP